MNSLMYLQAKFFFFTLFANKTQRMYVLPVSESMCYALFLLNVLVVCLFVDIEATLFSHASFLTWIK